MPRKRLLLFGEQGQVAWELRRTLAPMAEVTCVGRAGADLADPAAIRRVIADAAPDVIVNAAAYTAVDKAETETALATRINADAPGVMAAEAARRGALLVQYSTDYVFAGNQATPYTEEDPTGPLGAYGRTKLAGEEAIRAAGGSHLIFRLCWVYGNRGANFLLTMQRLAREREELRVVADQHGCPTWSRMIAEATAQALRCLHTPGDARAVTGTYHLCASGQTTWHAFARAIVEAQPADLRRCRDVRAITTAEYPTPARRPAYSVLDTTKLERVFGLRLPDWRESLGQVLAG
ncbi:MAG: dTDP-4-dehydrorhamnose reductase [Opitutaceae bacterium]